MSSALANALDDSWGRASGYHQEAVRSIHSKGASPQAALAASASPTGMGESVFGDRQHQQFQRQYEAASQDIPFTAIRPIAVSLADQVIRIGERSLPGQSPEGKFVEKDLDLAPLFVKQEFQGVTPLDDHPMLHDLKNPNPLMSGWALMYCTVCSLEATGGAVWLMEEAENPDGSTRHLFWYFPRTWIKPIGDNKNPYAHWKLTLPGVPDSEFKEKIPGEQVLFFRHPNPANPIATHSPVQAQSKAINTDDYIQKAQEASMRNVTKPGMLVTMGEMDPAPGQTRGRRPELTKTQRQQITNAIRKYYMGAMQTGEPLILDSMIQDVRPYMLSPSELDYQSGSGLTKNRIMQGIGTNPIIAGQIENANRAASFAAETNFNKFKVNPIGTLISAELTRKLGHRVAEGERSLAIWIEQAKARDLDQVARRVQVAAKSGVITKGELRHWVNTGDVDLEIRDDDEDMIPAPKSPNSPQAGEVKSSGHDPKQGQRRSRKKKVRHSKKSKT